MCQRRGGDIGGGAENAAGGCGLGEPATAMAPGTARVLLCCATGCCGGGGCVGGLMGGRSSGGGGICDGARLFLLADPVW